MSFTEIKIAFVKAKMYRIYFWCVTKDDAVNMMKKSIDVNGN